MDGADYELDRPSERPAADAARQVRQLEAISDRMKQRSLSAKEAKSLIERLRELSFG